MGLVLKVMGLGVVVPLLVIIGCLSSISELESLDICGHPSSWCTLRQERLGVCISTWVKSPGSRIQGVQWISELRGLTPWNTISLILNYITLCMMIGQ